MEALECIFCHTDNNPTVIKENSYTSNQCRSCNLIYVAPQPTEENIANLYGHDDAHIPAHQHIQQSYEKTLYAQHHLRIIKQYIQKGRLLEIGAGAGYFLHEARKQGFTPYGLELNIHQAHYIRTTLHIPCETVPLEQSTYYKLNNFNLMYHCDVLSHFIDPIKEFKNSYTTLTDNGYLIFETGNIGDIDTKYYPLFSSFQLPDHLFFFTENTIKHLLTMTGFECIAIHRYSIVPQLYISRFIASLRTKKTATPHNSALSSSLSPSLVKKAYHYGMYLIRYHLGKLFVRKKAPQTLLIIAKKIS